MASAPLRAIDLQRGTIYGPVHSRRLGLSLGVNILPPNYKLCSFNCAYCQYGWTMNPTLQPSRELSELPGPFEIYEELDKYFQRSVRCKKKIDCVTFSGNGEPTLHPRLDEIIEVVIHLRDRYLPQLKVAILSNSSTVGSERVRRILERFDLRIMKLDAGSEEVIHQLNGPAPPFYLGEIVAGLKQLRDVTLQSLFVRGRVTNSDPESVEVWLDKIKEIQPGSVQIYTLDRAPADPKIKGVNFATLQWIASQVRWRAGIKAELYP